VRRGRSSGVVMQRRVDPLSRLVLRGQECISHQFARCGSRTLGPVECCRADLSRSATGINAIDGFLCFSVRQLLAAAAGRPATSIALTSMQQ
jgi:hypothetical protein